MLLRREKKRIGDMLIAEHVITEEQLLSALPVAKEKGKKIGEVLVELNITSEAAILNALSQQLNMEIVDLSSKDISEDILNLIGENVLRKHTMIPFEYDADNMNVIHVAMADPMDMIAMDDFSIVTNLQAEPYLASTQDIMTALDKYYGDTEAIRAADEYAKERESRKQQASEADEAFSQDVTNSPVVQLVNSMLEQAARQRASDIHIEALETKVRVRFRIDGALYEKFTYSIHLLPAIIARLKIVGGMDISEKRKPQDGRITINVDRKEFDIRVSILPTVFGEKCVMRLAQKKALNRDKKELGFSPEELNQFDHILKNPNGIILVTGPTGSGKSTTLYTALSDLNKADVNIITVEDPVEANVDGVNQVQVNVKADLTFASALRSILRQDPDIIMIGEIRDRETAEIAVQASITGHLVVSTLHTNSSAGTLTRLMDMGIESYMLADSMVGVIAQRLVRKLCPHCKKVHLMNKEEKELAAVDPLKEYTIYEPVGCPQCNQTGYTGRTAIYEIMTITPGLREIITQHGTADAIKRQAQAEGMHTLHDSALRLVLDGTTSFHEMMRTTFEN